MPFPKKFQRKLARAARREDSPSDPAAETGTIPHQGIPSAESTMAKPSHAPAEMPPDPLAADPPVRTQIRDIARKSTYRIPGSVKDSESFDAFRQRALPQIRAAMQDLAHNPQERLGIILHSQTINLLRAWIEAGMPDDYSLRQEAMAGAEDMPAARLYPIREEPGWAIEPVDLGAKGELPKGSIYLIRHGVSSSAKPTYEKAGRKQDAMAELVKHLKSMDFGRARAFAHRAAAEHGIGEEELGGIIDSALPSGDAARELPNHHLLAVSSAAGPARRREYEGILRERFGDTSGLPPEARQALHAHLAQLGVTL